MDCNPPGSSSHGIFQTRILEWVLWPPAGDLSDPGIKLESLMCLSLAREFFTNTVIQNFILFLKSLNPLILQFNPVIKHLDKCIFPESYNMVTIRCLAVLCSVTQSCSTLCNHMNCSPPSSSVHGESPGKNSGVGCQVLLWGSS